MPGYASPRRDSVETSLQIPDEGTAGRVVRGVGDPTARAEWWGQTCERSELSGLFEWAGRACGPAAGLYGQVGWKVAG